MDCEGTATPQRGGRARLAVLIDSENAGPRPARAVLAAAEALGETTVRLIYAGAGQSWTSGWPAPRTVGDAEPAKARDLRRHNR